MNTAATLGESSWYAVSTRSRQEKVAASILENLAIENFLPLAIERRQWSDRKQMVNVPLFPGYLFVRVPMLREVQLRVLKVPGVVKFIGNQSGPQAIPDAEIEGVQTVLSHRIPCTPCSIPRVGDRVRIFRGVLTGVEGTFVRSGSDTRLVIAVEMIQQSISVQVDASDVEPVFSLSPALFVGVKPTLSAEHGLSVTRMRCRL
jgi:transcription termination/antitermination protein NusG